MNAIILKNLMLLYKKPSSNKPVLDLSLFAIFLIHYLIGLSSGLFFSVNYKAKETHRSHGTTSRNLLNQLFCCMEAYQEK